MSNYLRASISNGIPREQALIRRWWHEAHDAQGQIVWEYNLEGRYADAIWFPASSGNGVESPGVEASQHFPLRGQKIVLLEAKLSLNPELVGQALVYTRLALRAGASVAQTVIFAESGSRSMQDAARELGLSVVVRPLDEID